ncbi:band 4.1-like protein 4 isoform 2-T2 [Odontesthes bonariensis]|uniref:band 4.1-like protein 4 isoform X2 n=1 Tax=Odontesthes bonariensis TaxID=219752 RepID=UPI003F583582
MMTCFRGNREEFYGEVLLLDGRKVALTSEQGIKRSSKAAAILQLVFSHLNVTEVEFFGLRFCDREQRTHWLDPSRTLSQHRELVGPPYIFYFGVKFYAEDPSKLQEETTRCQLYQQVRQDICRGVLPCPAHLWARLSALMLQAEQGDHSEDETSDSGNKQEASLIHKTLSGVSRPEAQSLFLSLCSSLQMYGVSLFAAYGESQTEYFLGPTPVGVVIFKNKVLVGKYSWQRISKLHFKDKMFEIGVCSRNGSETSFFFQTSDPCDCKRLWSCCVEHHNFFRMSEWNSHRRSSAPGSSLAFPRLNAGMLRTKPVNNRTTTDVKPRQRGDFTNHTTSILSEPIRKQTVPPAAQRSEGAAHVDLVKPSAPWETGGSVSGLFNPKFPQHIKEERGPQRRSRSLDGDRPIRRQRRRPRSHGNASSGSDSERAARRHSPRGSRGRHGNQHPDCSSRHRNWSRSPDDQIWKHMEKQLVEPEGLINRQTEEIPYKEVRVSKEPIRTRRSPRRCQRWASASHPHWTMEMVPPLPVTMAADISGPITHNSLRQLTSLAHYPQFPEAADQYQSYRVIQSCDTL